MSIGLTDKQEMFCREYIVDLNATQAAIRAGYSKKTARNIASENLTKPDIELRIQELKRDRENKLGIDAAWVLKSLVSLHDKCMEAEQLLDENGMPTGMAKFNPSGAAKSLELIGRHVSVRAFELEQSPKDRVPVSIEIVNPHAN